MNTLDRKLELFAREEPAAADVQDAQRKLEQVLAGASPRRPKIRAGGWLAAAASAAVAVMVVLLLPLGSAPALAFSDVQQHFRDFRTLRFEIEQRMNGKPLMNQEVSLLANGSVRVEAGEDIVVVVNTQEKRVMTLVKPERIAVVSPLAAAGTEDDATQWLDEIRDFQGSAKALPGTRLIRGERATGWELSLHGGAITLWANQAGLPLEMTIEQGMAIDMTFRFEFDADLPAALFSTEVPAGYTLGNEED